MAASGDLSGLLALPSGGGAQHGIGETFGADAHTGTANASVPLDLPVGRNGLTPDLRLAYSSGEGNGPFGVGWRLSLPAITRKTSRGVPRFRDGDVFVLSGYEDLVPVKVVGPGRTRHRPRTEGLFALIDRLRNADGDRWEVQGRDGLVHTYGTARPAGAPATWSDPAALRKPGAGADGVFSWLLSQTRDPFGNVVAYEYVSDPGPDPGRPWDQRYLTRVRYGDYRDDAGALRFAYEIALRYDGEPSPIDGTRSPARPDPFSAYRSGFEIRTRRRCEWLTLSVTAPDARMTRAYRFGYSEASGRSLLERVDMFGFGADGEPVGELPPIEFGYTAFEPGLRRASRVTGVEPPAASIADPDHELIDLTGDGLPDMVRVDGASSRWWRNLGDGRLDRPRAVASVPADVALADPGVQLLDADGDGRAELLVEIDGAVGFVRLRHDAAFDGRSFRLYRDRPAVELGDPLVRLIDLDGDGVSDALRCAERVECYFGGEDGWPPERVRRVGRDAIAGFRAISFDDPRVRTGDMTGDGLQDVVVVHQGAVVYWPNAGHGAFGARVEMRSSPRLPDRYEPARLLLGDVDGDGCADLLYVDAAEVTLWLNRGGESWAPPVTIDGTPRATDDGTVRLVDMHGSGTAGVLWSGPAMDGRGGMFFLDLTDAVKPYLLNRIDNRLGAVTRIVYAPSTHFAVADAAHAATRWRTTLPFPVQVVERVERVDAISRTTLTTAYAYRHGYWDGHEREFRGFARVDVIDTLSVEADDAPEHYTPPALTRTWYHLGPVVATDGGFEALSLEHEYWPGDSARPAPDPASDALFRAPSRAVRRDSLRALRGSVLRTEVYAARDDVARPFSVVENAYGVREESRPEAGDPDRRRVFFPYQRSHRATQWERGDDPMTRVVVTSDHDGWGNPLARTEVGLPRRSRRRRAGVDETRVLAIHDRMAYAVPDDGVHIRDRVAQERAFGLADPPAVTESDPADAATVVADHDREAHTIHAAFEAALGGWSADQLVPAAVVLLRHAQNRYDGGAFAGRPVGEVGPYGALTRTDRLAFGEAELDHAYGRWRPDYLGGPRTSPPAVPAAGTGDLGYERRARSAAGDHDGFYVTTVSRRRDVHDPVVADPRGLVAVERDVAGWETTIVHDRYGLFPATITDSAGLTTTVVADYAAGQPAEMADPNGNRQLFSYTPLGLLASTRVVGRDGEGDTSRATIEYAYDLRAFDRSPPGAPAPISVRARRARYHESDQVPVDERDRTIDVVEWSDGLGRVIQRRASCDEELLDDASAGLPADGGPAGPVVFSPPATGDRTRVVVSGWQRYDNKGQVVERWEPLFSSGFEYSPATGLGQPKEVIRYDELGRPVQRIGPDGGETSVAFGTPTSPTPWEVTVSDPNDNAGRTDPAGALGYAHAWDTPTTATLDALGRTIAVEERNRDEVAPGAAVPPPAVSVTGHTYDVEGRLVAITDPLGRTSFSRTHDRLGRALTTTTLDAGAGLVVPDARGAPLEVLDARGAQVIWRRDRLGRVTHVWASAGTGAPLGLREVSAHGDGGDPGQPAAARAAARQANSLGRIVRRLDGAGSYEIGSYDFKGRVVESRRRPVREQILVASTDPGLPFEPATPDWSAADAETKLLDPRAFVSSFSYDAFDRVTVRVMPADDVGRAELRYAYAATGELVAVSLDSEPIVRRMCHDPSGRRTLAWYGCGVLTRMAYDPLSRRLARTRSEPADATATGLAATGAALQEHGYEYDAVGNVLTIRDRTPGCGIPGTALGADHLDREFGYDARSRLTRASGREADDAPSAFPSDRRSSDPTAVRAYAQAFLYDAVGNLRVLEHTAAGATVSRTIDLEPGTNRISRLTAPGLTWDYSSDPTGNVVAEGPQRRYAWDPSGRLGAFRGPGVAAVHLYDSGGSRVSHVARNGAGSWDATLTIDGVFETRRAAGAGAESESLLHVLEGESRVAIARTRVTPPAREIEYALADHLGSLNVVLDATGAPSGREEYFPFGETSLGGRDGERHRFTGRERDEESLLSYHGARFYAPWLGRWVSREPLPAPRLIQGASPFAYARANPMRLADPQGTQEYQPRPHLPLDGDPVPRTPGPEFPPWFSEDQKKAYIDRHNALGAERSQRGLDPVTGEKNLPYDPYLPAERRAMVVGEIARQILILVITSPNLLGRLLTLGAGIRLGTGMRLAAGSVTAEESLAAHLTRLEAEGVNVQRQAWVHVAEDDSQIVAVTRHGGAFEHHGKIYVNMDVVAGGVVDAELKTVLESRQVLQHELGHLGQKPLSVGHGENAYRFNIEYHTREAEASMKAAAQTANEVDRRMLLEHANANLVMSQKFAAVKP